MQNNIKNNTNIYQFAILGLFIFLGLATLGYLLGNAAIEHELYDRSIKVKGLSEREYKADIVIWPIQFSVASNDITELYTALDEQALKIHNFLQHNGIAAREVSTGIPAITDKSAQQYGDNARAEFRYTANQSVTVYSENIDATRSVMSQLSQLGQQGIVFTANDYQGRTEYLFTRLNEIKPDMIEEATTQARQVAQKFAQDSQSTLGKIKRASQGQFSINDRDRQNPHIKNIRVVSTIEYYLSD